MIKISKEFDKAPIRRRLGALSSILILAASSLTTWAAQTVTLAWDPSPDTSVVGYVLYYGIVGGNSTNSLDVANQTTGTVSNLIGSTVEFFYVTAYNAQGIESLPSNLITYTVPGTPPLSISSIVFDPSGFVTLAWPTVLGSAYRVVYKTNLTDPAWITLGQDLIATETVTTRSDYVVGNRFYSVIQLP